MPTVLVVDDSVSVRKVVERTLVTKRFDVFAAASGKEAIEQITRMKPDVVVCDVIMPDMDGYQICEFIKTHAELSRTPVLLMSGIVNSMVLERAAAVRSDEVMRKPFTPEELSSKIDSLLESVQAYAPAEPAPSMVQSPAAALMEAAPPLAVSPLVIAAPVVAAAPMEADLPPAVSPVVAAAPMEADLPPAVSPVLAAAPVIAPPPPVVSPLAATAPVEAPAPPVVSPVKALPSGADLKGVLGKLAALPAVALSVIVDREGFLIESAGEMMLEADVAGALAACLAESSEGVGRELRLGRFQSIILEYETGLVLLHGLDSTAMLAMVLRDAAVLGKVRYYVKKALPELLAAL